MKRDLAQLANHTYDLLVIGGGIYGATAAWDAALRGLSVALVERGDFGHATSSNSLKVVHGGLRYLQHADFKRMRESIRERRILMQIAPHLVHPLSFLLPTYGRFLESRWAMFLALKMNDLVSFDRNRGLGDSKKHLSAGRIISRKECLRLAPGVCEDGLTGGALWQDAQIDNTEQLLLSFIRSAADRGAQVANYVEATGFLKQAHRIVGAEVRDVLSGEDFEIRARMILNAAGPWVSKIWDLLGDRPCEKVLWCKAMNVVTRPIFKERVAVGVSSRRAFQDKDALIRRGSRVLFITPWRDRSIIGTAQLYYNGTPEDFKITEGDLQGFLEDINEAYPPARLTLDDVKFLHQGMLPMAEGQEAGRDVRLVKSYRLIDHQSKDGWEGLISLIGVKFTTARDVAQRAVDLVFRKLGKAPPPCKTHEIPLVSHDGSEYRRILPLGSEAHDLMKAQILYAIREEMAQRLSDVIFRRTDLGSLGNPGDECLQAVAQLMASELGWDTTRIQDELKEVQKVFIPFSP